MDGKAMNDIIAMKIHHRAKWRDYNSNLLNTPWPFYFIQIDYKSN
jgi:hypothetical protein